MTVYKDKNDLKHNFKHALFVMYGDVYANEHHFLQPRSGLSYSAVGSSFFLQETFAF